jgi:hypothetical protein
MRVFVIRRDDEITLILGTKHYVRNGEEGQRLYDAAQKYRTSHLDSDLQELQDLVNPYSKYVRDGILSEKNNQLYLSTSKIPLPAKLAKTIMEYLDNGYPIQPLVNFWHWCLLNPNTTARDRFFEYCETYGVTITDSGMAVLYKAVTHKEKSDMDLAHFVAQEYLERKRNFVRNSGEMSPSEYGVFRTTYGFTANLMRNGDEKSPGFLGRLNDLFLKIDELSLESKTIYTDKHSRTMDIKLGIPVFKKREECDPNIHNECSYGLHVGSFKYVRSFGYGSDTVFACLVNPMNVVALPEYDNSKIRVCEYLPYAIMNREGQDWEEIEGSFFEEEYVPYVAKALKDLEARFHSLSEVDYDGEAFEIIREQKMIVRTKLQDLYKDDLDLSKKMETMAEPIEAPYEETYFDVDDPWANNQLAPEAPVTQDHYDQRAKDAWIDAITNDGYDGGLDEYMRDLYSEGDECPECGYSSDGCDCDGTYITQGEAREQWRLVVASGSNDSFEMFVEDTLATEGVYVRGW